MAKFKRTKVGSILKGKQEEGPDGKPLFVKKPKMIQAKDENGKLLFEDVPVIKPDSLKVYGNHTLLDGQYLNLESKAQQLANLEKGVASGKLTGDVVEKIRERINKTPDFVRFDVIKLEKGDD